VNAELSELITRAVDALPAVHAVVPPGPALAVLVENVRRALEVPREGGAVLVRTVDGGTQVRVVVEVLGTASALDAVRDVRDVVRAIVLAQTGAAPAATTVRVVDIL
jgi:hypothetical protein